MKVEIYSDVVCPWCWIGKRRFERALAEHPGGETVEVVFRPFQLDPTASDEPTPIARYLEKRFGAGARSATERVSEVAAGEGLTMNWDRAQMANTRTAHRLLRLAGLEYGAEVQRRLAEQLFAGHFEGGLDVSDPARLTELAAAAGMDQARVAGYLASDEGAEELDAELVRARRLGISSVPTFVFDDRFAMSGAQPVEMFLEALREVESRAGEAAESGAS